MSTQNDKEFEEKLKKAFYKTSNKDYGSGESQCTFDKTQLQKKQRKESMENSLMYLFLTKHLLYCGMYKNASLNTTADKDRWVNGNKDWMEHLG